MIEGLAADLETGAAEEAIRRLENRLAQTLEALERSQSRLGETETDLREAESRLCRQEEFLQMAVHDLRSPLSAIVVYAELLMNRVLGDLEDRQLEPIRTIHRNCVNLIRMADDVLASAKVRHGQMELQAVPIDLKLLLSESIDSLGGLAEAKSVRIRFTHGEVPTVLGDPDKLGRAVCNVLGNAIKYSPHGGTVTVRLRRSATEIAIAITDDGPGISPEQRDAIFEKFERGESGDEGGHGLGLTIARHFIDLHGGRILVESLRGRGSTFLIGLPVRPASPLHGISSAN